MVGRVKRNLRCFLWEILERKIVISFGVHDNDITSASQIAGKSFVCCPVYSGWGQGKHHSSVFMVLCEESPPITGGFHSQRATIAENVSMAWRCYGDCRHSVSGRYSCHIVVVCCDLVWVNFTLILQGLLHWPSNHMMPQCQLSNSKAYG